MAGERLQSASDFLNESNYSASAMTSQTKKSSGNQLLSHPSFTATARKMLSQAGFNVNTSCSLSACKFSDGTILKPSVPETKSTDHSFARV